MEILLVIVVAWILFESVCALGVRVLHRRTGVFYSPRDAPRLSPVCRDFLERFVREGGQGKILQYSGTLGWTVGAGRRSEDGRPETDAHGARSRRVHSFEPAPGIVRIGTFGDCLTYGEGGSIEDTWQAQMESLEPRFEVLNFGVDGYGLDQCYLRYIESLEHYAGQSVVLVCFVSSNVYKSVNAFRPFYSHDHDIRLGKPRFTLEREGLVHIGNPLPTLEAYASLLDRPEDELRRLGELDDYYRATYSRGPLDILQSVRLVKVVWNEYRKLRAVRRADGTFVEASRALETTLAVCDAFCDRIRLEAPHPSSCSCRRPLIWLGSSAAGPCPGARSRPTWWPAAKSSRTCWRFWDAGSRPAHHGISSWAGISRHVPTPSWRATWSISSGATAIASAHSRPPTSVIVRRRW